MLAHGGISTALGLSYPDGEQRPKRGYPLGAHPLFHLARIQTGSGSLGLTYPDSEQIPKRAYLLGQFPLWHLARANGSDIIIPPTPPLIGGGRNWRMEYRDGEAELTEEEIELVQILAMAVIRSMS